MTSIRSVWSKFRDLMSMVASKGLSLEAKGSLYSACVCSVESHVARANMPCMLT